MPYTAISLAMTAKTGVSGTSVNFRYEIYRQDYYSVLSVYNFVILGRQSPIQPSVCAKMSCLVGRELGTKKTRDMKVIP